MLEILIIILTFSILIVLHELGHFLVAKKFGVKVEEFGLGLPPRLLGKKIGETLFSLNAIPFGGFVKMYGEEKNIKDSRSFTGKPIWQRILIVIAGCVAFWIVAAVLLSIMFGIGTSIAIGDDEENLDNIKVQIIVVASESPAEKAGLKMGDTIRELRIADYGLRIDKVREIQEFTNLHKGEEIVLTIEREGDIFETTLIPRIEPPEGEGAMGVVLTRTAIKSFPWNEAIFKGISRTGSITVMIIQAFGQIIESRITGKPLPPEIRDAEVMGPIGIFGFMGEKLQMGFIYFLKLIVIITIHLAIINLLPIPALDGGKLVFLLIEGIRGKPIPQKIEQGLTAVSFFLLIGLIIFITIRFDIPRFF